jgi:phosphoserine phosphatase
MLIVLTLIAGSRGRLSLPPLAEAIADAAGITSEPVWLAPDEACDLVFDSLDPAAVVKTARAAIGGAAVDVIVQPLAKRRKRLLIADLESTIIENEMLDELADFVGLRPQMSEITRRAMNGEVDFAAALDARVALLAGIEECVLDRAAERIRVTPGARQLVRTMRSAGAVTAMVSGGFAIFARRVAAQLGFDHVVANRLDLASGRLSGTVRPPVVTAETKRQTLLRLAAKYRIPLIETMAVGDGANDSSMLTTAGLGIAFHAKPVVVATVESRIDHADLTALLFAQGYQKSEFAG